MTTTIDPPTLTRPPAARTMIPVALAGGLVSVSLGVYGRVHEPTGEGVVTMFFPSVLAMKSALATLAFGLVLVQLLSALAMFDRAPTVRRVLGGWLRPIHRWSGTAAFLVTLPVAYHCLWSLGFRTSDTRVLAHGLFGCFFYGAFATKMLCLRAPHLPGWRLPVVGGLLVAALTGVWLTSALWFLSVT